MNRLSRIFNVMVMVIPGLLSGQSTGFQSPASTVPPNTFVNRAYGLVSDEQWAVMPHQSGCRCPYVYISYNGGSSYAAPVQIGPFGTSDETLIAGSDTSTWGRTWIPAEFSLGVFQVTIANPSGLVKQGYGMFNFNIPSNATITGIEVRVELHGDPSFTSEYLDHVDVNVHYIDPSSGIATGSAAPGLHVFPNPAQDNIHAESDDVFPVQLYLLNLQGQVMLEKELSGTADMDVSLLPRGIYFLRIITAGGIANQKIMLQ